MRYFICKSIPLLFDRSRERDDKLSGKREWNGMELISWLWNKNRIVFGNRVTMFVIFFAVIHLYGLRFIANIITQYGIDFTFTQRI